MANISKRCSPGRPELAHGARDVLTASGTSTLPQHRALTASSGSSPGLGWSQGGVLRPPLHLYHSYRDLTPSRLSVNAAYNPQAALMPSTPYTATTCVHSRGPPLPSALDVCACCPSPLLGWPMAIEEGCGAPSAWPCPPWPSPSLPVPVQGSSWASAGHLSPAPHQCVP